VSPRTEISSTSQVDSDGDSQMMMRALELAARGVGQVSPGPLVGCVIADAEGEIAGEGFYLFDRVSHAEAFALAMAGERARGGTAYISLEPHAHTGRTPPCTKALIEAGIKRVVASIEDPNPLVSGRGFAELREAGLEVVTGLLAPQASQLNEIYLHAVRTRRPFVHLKLASSLDGRIATRAGDSRWITGKPARARVHRLRHEYDGILIGAGTALKDNPLLTDRSGLDRHRPLARVVVDERLSLGLESNLALTAREAPVLVYTAENADASKAKALEEAGVEAIRTETGGRELGALLDDLCRRGIHSVLVEGGANVATRFLESGFVNKVSIFVAPIFIGGDARFTLGGEGALTVDEALRLREVDIRRHGDDVEITGYLDS
jgi:diaminohydroxyphosphoribosylaminopyrimidine deaminase/5-amino-6-(5-phosphoribosylamino)uracil reductase